MVTDVNTRKRGPSFLKCSCSRHFAHAHTPPSKDWITSVSSSQSVVKMASEKSVPSDLYKCVYSFLLENKFAKAAQQFLKQTKVVS